MIGTASEVVSGKGALARLLDEHDIMWLQRKYFDACDTKDWNQLKELLTEDAVFDFRQAMDPELEPVVGRNEVIKVIGSAMAPLTSLHRGYLRKLEFTGADTGRAVWAMEDTLWSGENGALSKVMHGYGHYHLTYRKVEGAWRIATWLLTRTFVERHAGIE